MPRKPLVPRNPKKKKRTLPPLPLAPLLRVLAAAPLGTGAILGREVDQERAPLCLRAACCLLRLLHDGDPVLKNAAGTTCLLAVFFDKKEPEPKMVGQVGRIGHRTFWSRPLSMPGFDRSLSMPDCPIMTPDIRPYARCQAAEECIILFVAAGKCPAWLAQPC